MDHVPVEPAAPTREDPLVAEARRRIADQLARRHQPARAAGLDQDALALLVDQREVDRRLVHPALTIDTELEPSVHALGVDQEALERRRGLDLPAHHDQLALASCLERGQLDLAAGEASEPSAQDGVARSAATT